MELVEANIKDKIAISEIENVLMVPFSNLDLMHIDPLYDAHQHI